MLCKKCKTAVLDTDSSCGYCGASMTHKRNKRISMAVFLCILGFLSTYLIKAEKPDWQQQAQQPGAAVPESSPIPEQPTPTPVKTEEPTPSSTPDTQKSLAQIKTMLNEVLVAANEFYEMYSSSAAYVSKNGYLYDISGETYVKIQAVVELMDLNPEYAENNILFFYLKPSDLNGIPEFSVKPGTDLEIFAAYETENGYMAVSLQSEGGIISRAELQRILEKYRSERGSITRFSYGSDDFLNIVEEISVYNNFSSGYDVRYLAGDDKYAVAVVSPVGSPEIIEEYVLVNYDGEWRVIIPNFEIFEHYKVEINRILPDLNLNLLPNYNMREYTNKMRNNFAEIINAMKASGMITERDGAASFASGTTEFVYLEFQTDVKFVGYLNSENVWVMFAVSGHREGEAVLRSITENPPLFIMKQY